MTDKPLSHAERGRLGGLRRGATLTPDEQSKIARTGAAATNSPEGRARSIGKTWAGLPPERREAVLSILREYGVIR